MRLAPSVLVGEKTALIYVYLDLLEEEVEARLEECMGEFDPGEPERLREAMAIIDKTRLKLDRRQYGEAQDMLRALMPPDKTLWRIAKGYLWRIWNEAWRKRSETEAACLTHERVVWGRALRIIRCLETLRAGSVRR